MTLGIQSVPHDALCIEYTNLKNKYNSRPHGTDSIAWNAIIKYQIIGI
jgi:hypothetical protein